MARDIVFTIVVLTRDRKEVLSELLSELAQIKREDVEVIVVDNGSCDGTAQMVWGQFPKFHLITLDTNTGIAGRNHGIRLARGRYTVTLDDDILGIDDQGIGHLQALFEGNPALGAVCFRVIDFKSGQVCNWCHPNQPEEFADHDFETNEITEGAVAYRNTIFERTGVYWDKFFISHEGADLAARIIEHGYEIHYTPRITVRHKYSPGTRENWRRYYYDTRNSIWLAIRNYRFGFGMAFVVTRIMVMFFYSVRDGFLSYWFRGVRDALVECPVVLQQRAPISRETERKMRLLTRNKPGLIYYVKKRLFEGRVRI